MEPTGTNDPNSLLIGPDRVTIEGDALVIYAKRAIPDWQVREFQKQPVFFQGEKYVLRHRKPATAPFAMRYELVRWPPDLHEESSQKFVYDENFVAERDRRALIEQRRSHAYLILLPFYPLLGFCWSGCKERVLWPLGFEPGSISSAATMLGFGAVLVDGILFGYLGGGVVCQLQIIGLLPLGVSSMTARAIDFILLLSLALDCALRFNQGLRGDVVPDGFLEWAFKPFRKPRSRDE